ncbi:MAG TPA: hypothetical protein VMK83_12650 [Gaiellaceae bacterium]|nr:hypothetical protein [Gaiellaceae bacterium]
MSSKFSRVSSVEALREAARAQGVEPTDADLEAVRGFLATILPTLAEIEDGFGPDTAPVALFLSDQEAR